LLSWQAAAQVIDVTQPPYNAKGDCKTDAAPAITAAMATGKRVYLPQGDYLIGSPIALSQTYAVLEGDGWSERGLAQHPRATTGCTNEPGTYISVTDPSVAAFTFSSPVGNSGPKFRHLAFLEKQPAPGPGWVPTVYPPVVTLDGSTLPNSGAVFEHIGFGAGV
jgi:polygalacturonase